MTMRLLLAAAVTAGALVAGPAFAGSPYYDQAQGTSHDVASTATPTSGDYSALAGDDATSAVQPRHRTAARQPAADPTVVKPVEVPEYFMHAQGSDGSN